MEPLFVLILVKNKTRPMNQNKKVVQVEMYEVSDLTDIIRGAVGDAVNAKIQELQTMDPRHKYVTTDEVKKILNVSRQTIYEWEKKKILVPFRFGTRKRFRLLDVHTMIEKGFRGNPPQESISKSVCN